ncbi:unnamed protein product [Symbiodinium necroappetens]|uniref:Uncharacterized protein n=1 Tax=Symbiodinium necroappetens TaxID=1628268 RepID=A0A812ZI14_9DINO|nr:unnamed protein product [Symbiodinium necroappetens]
MLPCHKGNAGADSQPESLGSVLVGATQNFGSLLRADVLERHHSSNKSYDSRATLQDRTQLQDGLSGPVDAMAPLIQQAVPLPAEPGFLERWPGNVDVWLAGICGLLPVAFVLGCLYMNRKQPRRGGCRAVLEGIQVSLLLVIVGSFPFSCADAVAGSLSCASAAVIELGSGSELLNTGLGAPDSMLLRLQAHFVALARCSGSLQPVLCFHVCG